MNSIILKKRTNDTTGDVCITIPAKLRRIIPAETEYFSCRMSGNDIVYSPIKPGVET